THPLQSTMDNQSLVIEQKTDAHLIQSDGLIFNILNQADNPIRDTNWFKVTCNGDPAKARKLLSEKLSAQPLLDSQLINVSMTASDPKDTATIVKVLVDEAIKQKRDFWRHKSEGERTQLVEQKNKVESELRQVRSDAREKA